MPNKTKAPMMPTNRFDDISIDNPFLFATNIKVPAYFDFDSVYLSQGYLQLNKVNVRANKFIESKVDMKKRGVASPDRAEAILLALYENKSIIQSIAPISIGQSNEWGQL